MRVLSRLLMCIAAAISIVATAALAWLIGHDVTAPRAIEQVARLGIAKAGRLLYQADLEASTTLMQQYRVGQTLQTLPFFVFERFDSPRLTAFRKKYDLDSLTADAPSEYEAMLRLARWVGTRFHHGTDTPPGDNLICDPIAVVEAGQEGAAYWCEIAARLMMQAATAVGWPARLITTSRAGYEWEHAVTELWSNQFDKWIAIDTDFNLVYESDGVPLSAWELTHKAPALQNEGKLNIRRIAPVKKGITEQDLLPYYGYIHVSLRTDDCSRKLPRGSPAGGDQATLWTARAGKAPMLSASPQAGSQAEFDWPLNHTKLTVRRDEPPVVLLGTISPVFAAFEYRLDEGPWQLTKGMRIPLLGAHGHQRLDARVITQRGDRGPLATIDLKTLQRTAESARLSAR